MKIQAGYEEGHLVAAAIRILTHRHSGRPPTVEEIAELAGLSPEWAGVLVSALEKAGAVKSLRGPYETRVEILDHLALEKLPREDAAAGVDQEIKEFSEKKRKEEEKLRNLFTGDALEKKEKKLSQLADEFSQFKPRPPKNSPLFGDPEDD